MNAQIINHEIQIEPLSTRVALHPFLAGMNHTQLTLLTDCAVARHFKTKQTILREGEFANGFYLIETGKVVLESEAGLGCSRRTYGNLQHARSSQPLRSFSTRQFCGNLARRTTR